MSLQASQRFYLLQFHSKFCRFSNAAFEAKKNWFLLKLNSMLFWSAVWNQQNSRALVVVATEIIKFYCTQYISVSIFINQSKAINVMSIYAWLATEDDKSYAMWVWRRMLLSVQDTETWTHSTLSTHQSLREIEPLCTKTTSISCPKNFNQFAILLCWQ